MAVSGADDLATRRIIDVGSDHGHLSLYSLINDNFAQAVLTDIHKAPAQRSEDTLRVYGYADRTEVYCTDGLDGVELKRGDIVVMTQAGYLPFRVKSDYKGTTHGAWNPYDSHIPLVFMGWHVPHGETTKPTRIVDLAPTICAMLHIQMPNACVGDAITFDVAK